jgi:riboflavin kinase/FMN adenylyltransferase
MQVHKGIDGLRALPQGGVISIGNFDGLHLGHRALLATMDDVRARSSSRRVGVVTFEPHPLTVLRPELAPPRLTPPKLKRALLERAGVDDYVVLPPDPSVLDLSAEEFWAILRDDVRPAHLVEGDTFNFGKDRRGTMDRLREWSAGTSVELHVVPPVQAVLLNLLVAPVSSSLIRWLLTHGRARDAAICLGRPYALRGDVVEGFRRGRTIGVPTANVRVNDQVIPQNGVYAGRCTLDGRTFPAAVNVGLQPTFAQQSHQIEAHLIGFDGDLYGQTIELELIDWLREPVRFSGIGELKNQIARDITRATDERTLDPARPIAAASQQKCATTG